MQPSTVLFCAYTKGGGLQSRLREVVERLAPLVGFLVRVTERGASHLAVCCQIRTCGQVQNVADRSAEHAFSQERKEKNASGEIFFMSQSVKNV